MLPHYCWPFINTPAMQRLKNIYQLGPNYMVFPGATHNRFEHSLGTAYLCEKQMQALKKNYQSSQVTKLSSQLGGPVLSPSPFTEREHDCIVLAGLFHDLGHGIYSHLFDRQVMKEIL